MGILIDLTFFILTCALSYLSYKLGKEKHGPIGVRKKIVAAFDDVKWQKQVFSLNGKNLSDSNGNTEFYPSEDIDQAIAKLNRVLEDIK